jgi:ornithine cyclodeaminase/alanine dehydrogenase
VFSIERLTVYDIRREATEAFAKEIAPVVRGTVRVAETPAEVPAEAQAVVCVTQSKDKYVQAAWYKPGVMLFPMGSYQECDDQCILMADKILVDHVGQCLHRGALRELAEAGRITERNIHATIGEVVAGKKPGRTSPDERILCVPIGTGAMDIAVAAVAYERATAKGLGGEFRFV